jgi:nucleoside 2-deoxyribosyltransferase
MNSAKCPVCKAPAKINAIGTSLKISVNCVRCGRFRCDHYAVIALRKCSWTKQQLGAACGYIRRNEGLLLTAQEVESLASLRPPSPPEKAARILLEMGKQSPQPGTFLSIAGAIAESAFQKLAAGSESEQILDGTLEPLEEYALELLAVASLSDGSELDWFLHKVLDDRGLIYSNRMFTHGNRGFKAFAVSPSGWQELVRLQEANIGSRIAFVAMSFQPQFTSLYDEAIKPGILAAGYEPERVDRAEHNNRIDDEIIARIKRSRFLVADFSLQRGGIYFEAGYALGLGLPVVWTANLDALEEVHFDNRQYNFITWREGEWNPLRDRLRFRIEATIGRGPVVSPTENTDSVLPARDEAV